MVFIILEVTRSQERKTYKLGGMRALIFVLTLRIGGELDGRYKGRCEKD